jgi:hypothetical protein
VRGRGVLIDTPLAPVVDRDDDERLDPTLRDEPLGRLVGPPLPPGEKGGGAVEDVLAVLHVEDGEPPPGGVFLLVLRGEVDPHAPLGGEDVGVEASRADVPGEGVGGAEALLLLPAPRAPARVERERAGGGEEEGEHDGPRILTRRRAGGEGGASILLLVEIGMG